MLGFQWVNGGEGLILRVHLQNSSTAQGLTGLDNNTTDLVISAIADNSDTATPYTANGNTIDDISTPGEFDSITSGHCNFAEVDDGNHPGLYEIQLADTTWADSEAKYVIVAVTGASGLKDFSTLIQLSSVPADLRQIEGAQLSDADLVLHSLSLVNPDGTALGITGSGATGAIFIAGYTESTPAAVLIGNCASGLLISNASNSANSQAAVSVGFSSTHGTGPAVLIESNPTGLAIDIHGGLTSGDAVKLTTTNGDGIVINSAGSGKVDVNATLPGVETIAANVADILDDTGTTGVVVATGSKSGYALSTAYDLYHADILFTRDEVNSLDEYTITWFKNGVRITSGITVPKIQVVKRLDGSDLVVEDDLTQIATTGSYKYNEDTYRITNGEAVIVFVTATIDGSGRSFARVVGRDDS